MRTLMAVSMLVLFSCDRQKPAATSGAPAPGSEANPLAMGYAGVLHDWRYVVERVITQPHHAGELVTCAPPAGQVLTTVYVQLSNTAGHPRRKLSLPLQLKLSDGSVLEPYSSLTCALMSNADLLSSVDANGVIHPWVRFAHAPGVKPAQLVLGGSTWFALESKPPEPPAEGGAPDVAHLESACAAGDAMACRKAAALRPAGEATLLARAHELDVDACDKGRGTACLFAAVDVLTSNEKESIALTGRACDLGVGDACAAWAQYCQREACPERTVKLEPGVALGELALDSSPEELKNAGFTAAAVPEWLEKGPLQARGDRRPLREVARRLRAADVVVTRSARCPVLADSTAETLGACLGCTRKLEINEGANVLDCQGFSIVESLRAPLELRVARAP